MANRWHQSNSGKCFKKEMLLLFQNNNMHQKKHFKKATSGGGGAKSSRPLADLDRVLSHAQNFSLTEDFVNGFNRQKACVRRCRFGRPQQ